MLISFYVLPGAIGLKFPTNAERDEFWKILGSTSRDGFSPQSGAERIMQRTIRFYPERMKQGFEWPMVFNGTLPAMTPAAKSQFPVAPISAGNPPTPKPQDFVTQNPFASIAPNAKTALPGLSPAPPPSMLAEVQPVTQATIALADPRPEEIQTGLEGTPGIRPASLIEAVAIQVGKIADDPEPPDKRKKDWKEWKARQK